MSNPGEVQLGGLVFGFTIASLMLWLGIGTLPFAGPVARWFRARMLAARGMPPLGRKAAAENMVPGQIVVGSIGAIVIGFVILWNAGVKISAELSATAGSAFPMLLTIFLGAAGLVGGAAVWARAATLGSSNSRRWVVVGVVIAIVGLSCSIAGIAVLLGAT